MKKNIIKALGIGTLSATLLITTVYATGTAGSSDDPLVTKSYVDTKINNALSGVTGGSGAGTLTDEQEKELVETITKQVLAIVEVNLESKGDELTDETKAYIDNAVVSAINDYAEDGQIDVGTGTGSSSVNYVPVELQNGQVLIGDEGTEIILRSGSAVSYVNSENGIINASNGEEYMEGVNIPKNNMLIVPRNDGRGVRATSNSTWFIVKGGYTIK